MELGSLGEVPDGYEVSGVGFGGKPLHAEPMDASDGVQRGILGCRVMGCGFRGVRGGLGGNGFFAAVTENQKQSGR